MIQEIISFDGGNKRRSETKRLAHMRRRMLPVSCELIQWSHGLLWSNMHLSEEINLSVKVPYANSHLCPSYTLTRVIHIPITFIFCPFRSKVSATSGPANYPLKPEQEAHCSPSHHLRSPKKDGYHQSPPSSPTPSAQSAHPYAPKIAAAPS